MLNDFFKVSKEDVDKAKGGNFPKFEHGDTPVFLIEELKEKKAEGDKKAALQIGCKVIGGEHDGKSYSHFIYENKGFLVNLMMCFFNEDQIMGGTVNPEEMIGRQFKTRVVLNKAKKGDKIYTNFYDLEAVSDVPDVVTDDEVNEAASKAGPTEEDESLF